MIATELDDQDTFEEEQAEEEPTPIFESWAKGAKRNTLTAHTSLEDLLCDLLDMDTDDPIQTGEMVIRDLQTGSNHDAVTFFQMHQDLVDAYRLTGPHAFWPDQFQPSIR